MDQFSALKDIIFSAYQSAEADSKSITEFHNTITPEVLFKLITELEVTRAQLAKANFLYEKKSKKIKELTHKYDSVLFKKKISEHTSSSNRWHWPEIVELRKQCLEKFLKVAIEDGSILEEMLSSVALESRNGAYSAVAATLGLDSCALQAVSLLWEEKQDILPPPISFEELKTKIMLYKQLAQTL